MKAVVQIRGEVNMNQDVRDTLSMLNIHNVNHCTLVPETDTYRGMVTKVNDYVAYGEPERGRRRDAPVEARASRSKARTTVDDEWVAENTDYDDIAALAEALVDEETHAPRAGPLAGAPPPPAARRSRRHQAPHERGRPTR